MKKDILNRILLRSLVACIFGGALLLGGQNCGSSMSTVKPSPDLTVVLSSEQTANPAAPTPIPSTSRNEAVIGPRPAIRDFQPTIAVRGTACLMCHANVSGNIITDFGFGSSYFFNSGLSGPYQNWYGDWPSNWGSAILSSNAQVYVPPAPTQSILGNIHSLADYIRSQLPGARVNEVNTVYIGAPTAARIREVGNLTPGISQTFNPRGGDSAPFSGISYANSKGYFTNGTNPVVCDGDLAIDGVLWLNRATIATYHGCHIYATGSVFISGPVKYVSVDSQSVNLQIASARAIYLGIGHACAGRSGWDDSYSTRIMQGALHPDGFVTRGTSTSQETLQAIQADADLIGTDMQDATCGPEGRNVGFLHMVLNAPIIQSRYQGVFTGSLIAEIALWPRNNANVAFDPVFTTLPVLPLLRDEDLLKIVK